MINRKTKIFSLTALAVGSIYFLSLTTSIKANVYLTVKMSMLEIFPMANKFDRKTAFFNKKQRRAAGEISGNPYLPSLMVYYEVKRDNKLIGYYFIDSHKVRTNKETIAVGLYLDFSIRDVKVLSFYEPKEYFPVPFWLKQFKNLMVSKKTMQIDYDIQGMTGATLTNRAVVRTLRDRVSLLKIHLKK